MNIATSNAPVLVAQWSSSMIRALGKPGLRGVPGSIPGWALFSLSKFATTSVGKLLTAKRLTRLRAGLNYNL